MKVHFLSLATVCVALLLTAGCKSNGGPWYNPTTYTFANPFPRSTEGTTRSPDALANNPKPSLGAQPSVSSAPGGYTQGVSQEHRLGGSSGTTSSSNPPSHWGEQNQLGMQGQPNNQGGYTDPVPSQYPPSYMVEPYTGQSVSASYNQPYSPQQAPSPYSSFPDGGLYPPQSGGQYGQGPGGMMGPGGMQQNYGQNPMSYDTMGGYQQMSGNSPLYNTTGQSFPADNFGATSQYPSNLGGMPSQNDPYAGFNQQAVPSNFDYYQQGFPPSQSYPPSTASPGGYQPYPPPSSGGGFY